MFIMSVNKSSSNNEKAFFFVRHNNDIDHMAPVIYKWLSMEDIPTDIIITTNRNLLKDYRIKLLDNFKNANVYHFIDLFNKKNILFFRTLDDIYLFFARCKRFENIPFFKKIVKRSMQEYKDNLFKGVDKAFVAFDWKTSYVIQKTIEFAKEKDFISISLPHGDNPFMSCMILTEDIEYSCKESDAPSKMFDYVVVPNYNCTKSYKIHLPPERIKTLGSPRYCNEWLKIISVESSLDRSL